MGEMLQEIKSYWSERAEGYSKVNQEELEGEQSTTQFTHHAH